jgi:hypothetical protein
VEDLARTETTRTGAADALSTRRTRRRRPFLGICVVVALLLGAAAAVDGQLGITLLAVWIGVLATLGWRTSAPSRPRRVKLVIGALSCDGEIGEPRSLAVVPSKRAARILRSRPRG